MHSSIPDLIERFGRLRVLVVGEAMLDSYLHGSAGRLSQEAPVPVVSVAERQDAPGGAANTAANLRALGAEVALLSVVGDDAEAALLDAALAERGVSREHLLVRPARRTLAKHRVMAGQHMLVRFDQGSAEPVDQLSERALIDRLGQLFPTCDAVVVSDYRYGIMTPRVIRALAALQAADPRVLVVDARDLGAYRQAHVTAVKPNYEETLRLLGMPPAPAQRAEALAGCGPQVLGLTGARIAAVTLDNEGALFFERGNAAYRTYARPVSGARTTGAGDTFIGALALALAAGAETPAAAEIAAAAAQIAVGQDGTSACNARLLREHFAADDKYLDDRARLAARVALLRQQGRRIVFTNGCFDILHRGHVTYLSRAKALGDVLIVGLNADESIRRLKGPLRPINTLEDRAQVLAALSCVDQIVPFAEDTPCNLIEIVRPDVFVKGGDYRREQLPEAPLVERYGGTVQILPYLEDRSTSGMIDRIRDAYGGRERAVAQ
ncbi:MAG TPA: D-glycero-beta-D-manno-heptose 1-phosphate adenylyltransferase [Roseiflexaceae bacterium]|nr:D-glycero-beta-D-manno-heptose 1-phosphate adenylyltransferase [Roseiflexaceae bacterium]